MNESFRLVCEDCLHSYVDETYKLGEICLECGGGLIAIKAHRGVVDENEEKNYRPFKGRYERVC